LLSNLRQAAALLIASSKRCGANGFRLIDSWIMVDVLPQPPRVRQHIRNVTAEMELLAIAR
jgi:hypothetical protein